MIKIETKIGESKNKYLMGWNIKKLYKIYVI